MKIILNYLKNLFLVIFFVGNSVFSSEFIKKRPNRFNDLTFDRRNSAVAAEKHFRIWVILPVFYGALPAGDNASW